MHAGGNAIITLLLIGYDRYNIIVRGFNGTKLNMGSATIIVLCVWIYSFSVSLMPFFGWGHYALEGLYTTCGYDYLSFEPNDRSFMGFGVVMHYCVPMVLCCFFYSQIVIAVVSHEKALKEQAKKMNVESLRSGDHVSIYLLASTDCKQCKLH